MQAELYYRHSGRFPVSGPLFGWSMGAVAGAILGIVYVLGTRYIPLVYVGVLLAFGYGYVVGWISTKAMTWLKVRNATVIRGVAFLAALAGLYVCWVVWVKMVMESYTNIDVHINAVKLLVRPRVLWHLMSAINETGTWSLSHHGSEQEAVKGVMLWIVWVGEALIILGMASLAASTAVKVPFCEFCRTWCKPHSPSALLADTDKEALRQHLEEKDFAYLLEVGPQPVGSTEWTRLDVFNCPKCGQTNTVSGVRVAVTVNKRGDVQNKEEPFMGQLLLDPEQNATLLATCAELKPVETEAAPVAAPVTKSSEPEST